jgi:hypothetical protein
MDLSMRHRKPTVEALEGRSLPSAAPGLSAMTYNLNEGTDFLPLLSAAKPKDVAAAVTQTWSQVVSSNIPDRAMGLAQVIAKAHPTLAGLQEAAQYTVNGKVKYDLLSSLLTDLAGLGQHYTVALLAPTFAAQAPDAAGETIGFQDENVILARTDLPAGQLALTNPQHGLFTARVALNIGGTSVPLTRSWASVDVTSGGATFRFVTAHLEDGDPTVRTAQAKELLAGPAQTALPVVFVGDTNSPAAPQGPDSGAYNALVGGGFTDAWSVAHPNQAGYTWGAGNPGDATRTLTQRIDVVLVRGGLRPGSVTLAGGDKADKTASGLWPSDHDGVVAGITQTVSFNPATGVLFVRSDTASGNDTVSIRAAGAKADGSTGVTLTSNLTNGQSVTYGDAAHPVKQISLDLKDGNDTVQVADLAAVDVFVGEGNGNDTIQVGHTAGAAVIAGSGHDSVVLGNATRDQLLAHHTPLYVGLGYTYGFDAAGGSFGPTGLAANAANNTVRVNDGAGGSAWVDVNGTGSNTIIEGDGAADTVHVNAHGGRGNNTIVLGNGDHDAVMVDGTGGTGSSYVEVGKGAGDAITVKGDGSAAVGVGSGGGATIDVEGAGFHVIEARKNAKAKVIDIGGGGGFIGATADASVTVNGVPVIASGIKDGVLVLLGF